MATRWLRTILALTFPLFALFVSAGSAHADLDGDLDALVSQIVSNDDQQGQLARELRQINSQLADLENQMVEHNKRVADHSRRVREHNANQPACRSTSDSPCAEWLAEAQALNDERDQLRAEGQQIATENDRARGQGQGIVDQLAQLKQERERLETERTRLQISKVFLVGTLAQARQKVPQDWGAPSVVDSGVGVRWVDPHNPDGNSIRINRATPESSSTAQHVDHVRIIAGDNVIGIGGKKLPNDRGAEASVPLSDWTTWHSWDRP
ncbi:hypothetical protein FZI91_18395 [Mycobacterium sp. CBMA271]|uniref:hypothetical protein n=1 Tax=unclassified Mycobacteroides TaxID=2618759 RepID=UPI0012DCB5E9|nr:MULTISPECIES: hypothetical protein [unclassified Mycobacteroides]MUM18384.1 hypothetical protein [Mycobacteroides sp. CBMA 326]MUM23654.1 hypothetical protein [Mycobacteroides sp. CBMA 271]